MKLRILILGLDTTRIQALSTELAAIAQGDTLAVTTAQPVARLLLTGQRPDLMIGALTNEGLAATRRLRERVPRMQALLLHEAGTSLSVIAAAHQLDCQTAPITHSSVQLARQAGAMLGLCAPEAAANEARPGATLADVQLLLDVLRRQTQAQLVIFTDHLGNIITQRGDTGPLDTATIGSLVSGGFANAVELGRTLRDPDTRLLSVLEGAYFDVYATNVNAERLLILVFAKEYVEPKLGFSWLLLRRAAGQLGQMRIGEARLGATGATELSHSLNTEFDRIFGDFLQDAPQAAPGRQ